MIRREIVWTVLFSIIFVSVVAGLTVSTVNAVPGPGVPATYTWNDDFDAGTLINMHHDPADQLQLLDVGEAFEFLWVAASGRGTIVRIDTTTGQILGEYQSAPNGRSRNPSRTTVDANGNVWAGNRDESSGSQGSVVHIGLEANGQCVDRNNNGVIDTSTGLSDILPWSNPGGVDDAGGVSSATDECIIHYVRTSGTNVRTVAVDGNNNLWVGGYGNKVHELYDSDGNAVAGTQFNPGCGGYGGLVDGNGVLWSAGLSNDLLHYDPSTNTATCITLNRTSYGLGIDANGYIWHSCYNYNDVIKLDGAGTIVGGPYPSGGATNDRGVAVTPADNDVWVANSGGSDVSRLDNSGLLKAVIPVGTMPTGVAVDAAGKVWVTNYYSHSAMRIDPATDSVDLTVSLGSGAYPYNYSDMTGSTLTAPPDAGTWTIVHDSGGLGMEWGKITWNASTPGDSAVLVSAASSTDGVTFGPSETVTQGVDLTVADGQYLKVMVSFVRSTTDDDQDGVNDSPVLYDLTIDQANEPPDCSGAFPSVDTLWPPNHKFHSCEVLGVTDPDGDAVTITVDGIYQDELVDTEGDGSHTPDGMGLGSSTAELRAERCGPEDGRVYRIEFTATDELGGACSGEVSVAVPHDHNSVAVDSGTIHDSTVP